MNIAKETRFVWFIVLMLVVFAFVAHDKGGYDHVDYDFAWGETPPPPPPPGSSCVPGFGYAAFGINSISITGSGNTDSYDSSVGPALTASNGGVCTNSTSMNAINLSGGGTVNGNACVGVGGNPATVVHTSGGSSVASTSVQTANPAFPPVAVPVIGTNQGDQTGGALVLTPNLTYGKVVVNSGSLTLNAGTYVMDELKLTGSSTLTLATTPVLIYLTGTGASTCLDFSGGTVGNAALVAGNLVIMAANACTTVKLSGGASAAYAVYAPNAAIDVSGSGDLYGSAIGKSINISGSGSIHYDRSLATLSVAGFGCGSVEVSRSSPIVAALGGVDYVFQGSFYTPWGSAPGITSPAAVSGWTFPYIVGKMRARLATTITTTVSAFSAGTLLFDTAGAIPTATPSSTCGGNPVMALDSSCRKVFTTTTAPNAAGVAWHPGWVEVNEANSASIGPLIVSNGTVPGISAQYNAIIDKIATAKMGGVDRSTVAVIPPSAVAGLGTRPTMVYFGGTDGMLHAACATVGGITESQPTSVCGLGKELWAFLPRSQLPLIATNMQRIDGSPRVVDMFGDFTNAAANGIRSWRTILTFQTGYAGTSTGATYALDVTDPANPVVLWEYATPSAPASLDLGAGLTMAAGETLTNGTIKNIGVIETNNGGTGGSGVVATGVQMETGTKMWQFGYAYPNPPRGAGAVVPATGIVGGAVAVDLVGASFLTDAVFGDLYGNIWRLDITTGKSRNSGTSVVLLNGTSTNTTGPLFSFSTNLHPFGAPPAIYANNGNPLTQYAVLVSGGYDDPTSTSWSTNTQYLIGAKLNLTGAATTEATAATATGPLSFNSTINSGDKGFSQALVVGQQIFVTSDSADVSSSTYGATTSSGHLMTMSTTSPGVVVVSTNGGGAGSVANSGTAMYGSTSTGQVQLSSATSATNGQTVDTSSVPRFSRNLWLRTQ